MSARGVEFTWMMKKDLARIHVIQALGMSAVRSRPAGSQPATALPGGSLSRA